MEEVEQKITYKNDIMVFLQEVVFLRDYFCFCFKKETTSSYYKIVHFTHR